MKSKVYQLLVYTENMKKQENVLITQLAIPETYFANVQIFKAGEFKC